MNSNDEIIEIGLDSIVKKQKKIKTDFEKGFNFLNPFFIVISLSLIFIFIIQISNGLFILGENLDINNLTYKYSNFGDKGHLYGILTYIFLHGSIEHLLGNLLLLYIFSLIIYKIFQFKKSIILFIMLGVIAGIPGYFLNESPSIGSSGAIFGLFGITTIFYIINKHRLEDNILDIFWILPLLAGYQIYLGFLNPMIDNNAHMSGYIGGIIIGYFIFRNKKS